MRTQRILTNEDIMRNAPSVFSQAPQHDVSDRYRFLSTIKVIDALRDNGYEVAMASQSMTKDASNKPFARHLLRLRHRNLFSPDNVGDEIPELALTNSHNRSSTYNLMFGIFRMICSNGMVVASSTINAIKVVHRGDKDLLEQIIKVSKQITGQTEEVFNQINRFKGVELDNNEQIAFAEAAKEIVPTTIDLEPRTLLSVRRYADRGNGSRDLWRTSNIVQENIIKGGARGRNTKGNRTSLRAVKSIKNNININQAIWKLTEKMAELKTGQNV